MTKVKVSGTINAPADKVWRLVGNFSELDTFVEAVTNCTSAGSGTGAVRTLTLEDGSKVKEKLDSLDHDKRTLTYSILESPMPINSYTGTMQVRHQEDGQSEFTWSSTFEAAEGTEDDMQSALKGLYSQGVEGLQNKF